MHRQCVLWVDIDISSFLSCSKGEIVELSTVVLTYNQDTWEAELEDSTFGWATMAGSNHRQGVGRVEAVFSREILRNVVFTWWDPKSILGMILVHGLLPQNDTSVLPTLCCEPCWDLPRLSQCYPLL